MKRLKVLLSVVIPVLVTAGIAYASVTHTVVVEPNVISPTPTMTPEPTEAPEELIDPIPTPEAIEIKPTQDPGENQTCHWVCE